MKDLGEAELTTLRNTILNLSTYTSAAEREKSSLEVSS